MKRAIYFILVVMISALLARADFDPSRVIDLSVQFTPSVPGTEISPFPFILGETTVAIVTASFPGGITDVPVPLEFITPTSLNTNIITVGQGLQISAVGYGATSINFKVGALTKNKTIKVVAPAAQLVHRYSFDTNADPTLILDSVGNANGILTNDTPGGTFPVLTNGEAQFDGLGGYIKLPCGTASQFTNLSLMIWVDAAGSPNLRQMSRLIDFAVPNTNTPPGRAAGLALEMDPFLLRAGWPDLSNEVKISWQGVRTGLITAMAAPSRLLFGQAGSLAQTPKGITNFPPLSTLMDTDDRIGGSLATNYAFLGSLGEVRMYEGLLSDYDIGLIRTNGPNVVPQILGELRRVRLTYDATPLEFGNPQPSTYQVLGDFTGATNVDLVAAGLASLSVPFGTNGPILLIGTNQLKVQGIGPVNVIVASKIANSNLATFSMPISPPLQVRLQLPGTAFSSRSPLIPYSLRGDYLYVSNVDLTGNSLSHFTLSDTNVFQFRSGFNLLPLNTGTATLSAQYLDLNTSAQLTVTNPAGYAATYPQLLYRWQFDSAPGSYYSYDSISNRVLFVEQIYSLVNNHAQQVGTPPQFDGVTTAHLTAASGYFGLEYGLIYPLTNCTIECWVRCSSVVEYRHFFDIFQPSNPYDSNPYLGNPHPLAGCMFLAPASTDGTGGLQAVFQPGGADSNQFYRLQAPTALAGNTWTHITWVHSPTLGIAELYVNGTQVGATNTSIPFASPMMTYGWLGRNSASPDRCFAGDYDEVRIYAGALSPAQVQMNDDAGPQVLPLSAAAAAYPYFSLQPEPDGQHFKVRVPHPKSGVVLETSVSLGTNAVWLPVNGPTQVEPDETSSMEISTTASNAFFRLRAVH